MARLLEAEGKYIELSRRLYEDPETALAQQIETLRSTLGKNFAAQEDIDPNLIQAREEFAQGQSESGFQSPLNVIELLLSEEIESHCKQILAECSMREFSQRRMEYPILAIIAMGRCMK